MDSTITTKQLAKKLLQNLCPDGQYEVNSIEWATNVLYHMERQC